MFSIVMISRGEATSCRLTQLPTSCQRRRCLAGNVVVIMPDKYPFEI